MLRLCEESEKETFLGWRQQLKDNSEFLQPTVHVSLAAFPGPGATLQAKFLQILLVVLVVHGPVGLWFTLRLDKKKYHPVFEYTLIRD